jgi:hypothetical protein
MHLKILLLTWSAKLSTSKAGCIAGPALHFSLQWTPPVVFWRQTHSDECFFSFSFKDYNLFYMLEGESGFGIATQLRNAGKRLRISNLWIQESVGVRRRPGWSSNPRDDDDTSNLHFYKRTWRRETAAAVLPKSSSSKKVLEFLADSEVVFKLENK